MRAPRRTRWRRAAFPQIGGRILDRRGVLDCRVPFGGWLAYVWFAWLTRRLVMLSAVGVAPIAGLYLTGIGIAFTPVAFALSAAILAGIALGGVLRPRIECSSSIPARVEAGQEFTIRYDVRNLGRRTVCDLCAESFLFPGFPVRLIPVRLPALPPGGRCTAEARATGRQRGRFRLPPLRCDTDFPSGLWCWGRTDWTERRLTVHPSYARLASLELPDGARHRQDMQTARQLTRSALEFHGCREFRSGDSLRHVHARSSARLGIPVVKEFQAEGRGRTAIVVDTWRRDPTPEMGVRPDPVIEAALSLAASVADYLARNDRVLELLVAGPGLYRFVSEGRIGFLEDVLDILASVEVGTRDTLPQLVPTLIEEIRQIESVCLILGRWNEIRAALVRELSSHGVGVKVVLVTRYGKGVAVGLPEGTIHLGSRTVLRGEVGTL